MKLRALSMVVAIAVPLAVAACKGEGGPVTAPSGSSGPSAGGAVTLQGAGATFPYPLYSKWVAEYEKVDPKVRINYQSIGSGGGIKQVTAGTVDFGASDAPMTDAELARAPKPLVHVPTTLGAVAVAYHLPGVPELRLGDDALLGIYLGEIKSWNDPRIAAHNPGVTLPASPITPVYRTDGSGTTAVFTEYLAAVGPAWKQRVGAGKAVRFPVGLGAKGNEGVAGQVRTTPGTIGYVEVAYAMQTGLSVARVRNAAGEFVAPTVAAVSAAAAGAAAAMPPDLRTSIVNAPGGGAYPISAFTYVLVHQDAPDATKGAALARFLWWAVHDGQRFAEPLHYAPLPAPVVQLVEAKLKGLRASGKPIL